jgi:hypothetical protein
MRVTTRGQRLWQHRTAASEGKPPKGPASSGKIPEVVADWLRCARRSSGVRSCVSLLACEWRITALSDGSPSAWSGISEDRRDPKRDEPHGRLQGATNLHGSAWSNRRSREERQGRNELGRWQPQVEGAHGDACTRSCYAETISTEGHIGQPHGRSSPTNAEAACGAPRRWRAE